MKFVIQRVSRASVTVRGKVAVSARGILSWLAWAREIQKKTQTV